MPDLRPCVGTTRRGVPEAGLSSGAPVSMAQKYRLVKMKNMGKDKDTVPVKFYAYPTYNGRVSFADLCEEIAESCTLTSADIKAVLDRVNVSVARHLKAGRIVILGELGNFRFALGSSGSATEADFMSTQIRTPKVVFTPGSFLREARKSTSFEREQGVMTAIEEPANPPTEEDNEGPDII